MSQNAGGKPLSRQQRRQQERKESRAAASADAATAQGRQEDRGRQQRGQSRALLRDAVRGTYVPQGGDGGARPVAGASDAVVRSHILPADVSKLKLRRGWPGEGHDDEAAEAAGVNTAEHYLDLARRVVAACGEPVPSSPRPSSSPATNTGDGRGNARATTRPPSAATDSSRPATRSTSPPSGHSPTSIPPFNLKPTTNPFPPNQRAHASSRKLRHNMFDTIHLVTEHMNTLAVYGEKTAKEYEVYLEDARTRRSITSREVINPDTESEKIVRLDQRQNVRSGRPAARQAAPRLRRQLSPESAAILEAELRRPPNPGRVSTIAAITSSRGAESSSPRDRDVTEASRALRRMNLSQAVPIGVNSQSAHRKFTIPAPRHLIVHTKDPNLLLEMVEKHAVGINLVQEWRRSLDSHNSSVAQLREAHQLERDRIEREGSPAAAPELHKDDDEEWETAVTRYGVLCTRALVAVETMLRAVIGIGDLSSGIRRGLQELPGEGTAE